MTDAPQPLSYNGKPFWSPDVFDCFLPRTRGFVNDFVLSLRGHEVPVAFSLWSALVALSTALKRETWLKWSDDNPLYPNVYLILVSPAGMAKKSVPISLASESLEEMKDYFTDANVLSMKQINIFRDKITGEGIAKFLSKKMRPLHVNLVDATGKPRRNGSGSVETYERCAEVLLVAPELGTMLSQAKYNADLITTLTKLYDTESRFEATTSGGGQKRLPRPFACLLGGTNPAALRDSIPKTAVDEGFISRLVLCYQPRAAQPYHRPRSVGIPRKEIASRLAWIAQNTAGQWDLSPEADAFYEKWYNRMYNHYDTLRFHASQRSRFGIHVLKAALLLSAQEYKDHLQKKNRLIQLPEIKLAISLVEMTMETAVPLIEETEANPVQRMQIRVFNYIKEKHIVDRKTLLQNAHITASEATATISDLFQAGKVIVRGGGSPQFNAKEKYIAVKPGRKPQDDETQS